MKTNEEIDYVPQTWADTLALSPLPGTSDGVVTNWRMVLHEPLLRTGLLLLAVSGGLFVAHDTLVTGASRDQEGLFWFMLHYLIAITFGVTLLVNGSWAYLVKHNRQQQATTWISLLLWYISAFALNRQMAVFDLSVPWLCPIIVGSGALMVLHTWADLLPRWGQQLLYGGLAGAGLLFGYQAVYVASLYPLSVPGLLLLGLTVHTFVPALLAFVVGRQLWVGARQRTYLRGAVLAGIGVPVALLVLFLFNWQRTVSGLNQVRRESALRQTSDLPDWVQMARQLTPGPLTDRVLKVGMVYGTAPWSRTFGNLTALDDVRLHDPLVVIAQNLFPVPAFAGDEQMKLLRATNQQHYGTESKFWSGRNLTTTQVATQVRIWPQHRLSYTEKTLWVQSAARWGNREALYTFHLPEGAAVSALSLWINGVEETARLTTQAKADSAYKQIVDVESRVSTRDPSVVSWQEGNRVTVRVFPVGAGQGRQLKIGITAPLDFDGKLLTYLNPWFEGPDASRADETTKLTFDVAPDSLVLRKLSGEVDNQELLRRGTYQPDWSAQMVAPALSVAPFSLAGTTYRTRSYVPGFAAFEPTDVYLDVNAAWQFWEMETAYGAVRDHKKTTVWVFDDGLKQVTAGNLRATYDRLAARRFSLFPVYRISHPATALLVTKGTEAAPTLSDLTGSAFDRNLVSLARLDQPIRTFWFSHNDNNQLSPYLKTLRELRVVTVWRGSSCEYIHQIMDKHLFPATAETPDRVVLSGAGMVIDRQADVPGAAAGAGPTDRPAPDHLLRLFTYNSLMRQVGRQYFDKKFRNNDALAAVAQLGHVVSPVSSLVVLETAADYKRFDIKTDRTGLDNATLKQEGAVPEPHEWAMLVAIALLVGWFYGRPRLAGLLN